MRPIWIIISAVVVAGAAGSYFFLRGKVDTKKADREIKAWAENDVGPVSSVDCPDGEKAKKGVSFKCNVTFVGGKSFPVQVDMIDDDGEAKFYWSPAVVREDKMAGDIASAIKNQQGKDVTLDCGKDIVQLPPEGLVCAASMGNVHGKLRVKFDSASHQLVWSEEQ